MNDFRKTSRRSQRQAIDGILNAPSRARDEAPSGHRRILSDSFRSNTPKRTIGNFGSAEGYTPSANSRADTNTSFSPAPSLGDAPKTKKGKGPSLLHLSLPGSGKDEKKSKAKGPKKHHWWHGKKGKWVLRTGIVVIALILGTTGFLGTKLYAKLHKVFKGGGNAIALEENVSPDKLNGEGDGRINILLMGRGGEGHSGADLTDTILLVSIDPVNKTSAMVSIPRDMWVTVQGSSYKINATYAYAKQNALRLNPKDKEGAEKAGVAKIESTVSDILDLKIHYYAMVDFQAFKQAVDSVGGVDANVPSELTVVENNLYDESTGKHYNLNVGTGQQHFDGVRALFYARSRHTSPRGDFDRTERQKLLIQALSQKVVSAGTYTNPAKLSGLMSAFGDHVSTDLSINNAVRLLEIAKGIGSNIDSVDLAVSGKAVVTTGMISGQSVVLPSAGQGNYKDIQALVHSKMRDGYLTRENAEVAILNGTSKTGLASAQSDQLKYYGYNVVSMGSAPTQTYDQTVIVDLSGGKNPYTQNYLEKRYNVKVVSALPDQTIQPGNAKFVIILGRNVQ